MLNASEECARYVAPGTLLKSNNPNDFHSSGADNDEINLSMLKEVGECLA